MIYEELLAEGFERKDVDWYLFCLSENQPKEPTMDQDISNLLGEIAFDIEYARKIADSIARGTGDREVAMCITNMQYALWSLQEAQRLIGLEGAKERTQALKDGTL